MTLASHVATLGRGPGRSRSLTRDEAIDAMAEMLSGQAAPEAIGALLMLLRMKGETAEEIAGFAAAAQSALGPMPQVDLDWPSYAAGRTRGHPWFLLSARLVADAGYRVMIHGRNGSDAALRAHLGAVAVPVASDGADVAAALDTRRIAYAPLEAFHPALSDLLALRSVLGLRSCVNTVCRMLNPGQAEVSVQGVFHPSYRLLQADAAALLGWRALSVIKGGGGEFERHPGKAVNGFGLRVGRVAELMAPALGAFGARRLADVAPVVTPEALWAGCDHDTFAEEIVIGTAALALGTLGATQPEPMARELWAARNLAAVA